ncbi:hypothetical protein [Caballeronia sp. LZ035]|uniref:hypothetical protein n=1 Tax=Caballeronia sp. LZ035 TaxID=3038568 RepID=UPI0028635682|nr:hypothetical protein [Caballeronia sp. LZ035]MDR5761420.1 hypothetical protein [Caballeronia sp. LZ035]
MKVVERLRKAENDAMPFDRRAELVDLFTMCDWLRIGSARVRSNGPTSTCRRSQHSARRAAPY